MKIIYGDIVIKQDANLRIHFNVYRITYNETGNHIGEENHISIGYGMTLPAAIHALILNDLYNKYDVVTLEFLVANYKKAVHELTVNLTKYIQKDEDDN